MVLNAVCQVLVLVTHFVLMRSYAEQLQRWTWRMLFYSSMASLIFTIPNVVTIAISLTSLIIIGAKKKIYFANETAD